MKENKLIKYSLIIAVLGIWGLIGYRVYQSMNPTMTLPTTANNYLPKAVKDQSLSFSVMANYRDPFLSNTITAVATQSSQPFSPPRSVSVAPPPVIKQQPTPKPKRAKRVQFPLIIYKGYIQNNQNQKKRALVKIDKRQKTMTIGDEMEGIRIMGIYTDSLKVVKEGKFKTIRRAL